MRHTLRLQSKNDYSKAVARVYRAALGGHVAVINKPRTTYARTVQVVPTDSEHYQRAAVLWPERILGTYQFRGDGDALLQALMDDFEEIELGLA